MNAQMNAQMNTMNAQMNTMNAQMNANSVTRSGKKYSISSNETSSNKITQKKHEILVLQEKLEAKIKYNLANGVYGQSDYIDDYAEIHLLEYELKRPL
jgi:flagellar hook assembly protein FlgD